LTIGLSDVLTLALMTPVLFLIMFSDLSQLRIPNFLVLTSLAIFVVAVAPALTWSGLGWRVVGFLVVFAFCFGSFVIGQMGAGDAKLLPTLTLFVAPEHVSLAMILLACFLLGGLGAIALARPVLIRPGATPSGHNPATGVAAWKSLVPWKRNKPSFPKGFPIAGAALAYLAIRLAL
jgi:prepilin peptidase CpaA